MEDPHEGTAQVMLVQHDSNRTRLARDAMLDYRDEQNVLLFAVMIGIGKALDERHEPRELSLVVRIALDINR
jgi:hypothetical protein